MRGAALDGGVPHPADVRDDHRPDRRQLRHVPHLLQDPGRRSGAAIAGRTATQENITAIRDKSGSTRRLRAVVGHDEARCSAATVILHDRDERADSRSRKGMPATFSLMIGAAIIWLGFGVLVGALSAVRAGPVSDKVDHRACPGRISLPVVWLGLLLALLPHRRANGRGVVVPGRRLCPIDHEPVAVVLPPDTAVVHARHSLLGFYGRVFCARTSSTRSTRTSSGPRRRRGCRPPNILRQAHASLRRSFRSSTLFGLDFAAVLGGGAIITETVFDCTGWALRCRVDPSAGSAAADGRDALRRVHRGLLRRDRRRRVRVPGPEDPPT